MQCILINAECYEVGIYVCRVNFHSSIQNIIHKNLHYCWTRWTQNNKIFCIECVGNLVHIWRLFPHHPRGKSHWRIVFLAATAAQEAHLSLRPSVRSSVCVYQRCVFKEPLHLGNLAMWQRDNVAIWLLGKLAIWEFGKW